MSAFVSLSSRNVSINARINTSADEELVVQSGNGFVPHRHHLVIPLRDLESPPTGGIKIKTRKTLGHVHYVALTQKQLQAIENGETIEVLDTFPQEHRFRIYKP